MADWSDNDRNDFESATMVMCELARELPDDIVYGVVVAACGVFYWPALVVGHARRGLRDFRDELKKWTEQEPVV